MISYREALDRLVGELKAERALVLSRREGKLVLEEAHGFEVATFWQSATVSFTLLQEVSQQGQPLLLVDGSQDPVYGERWSLAVAEIRSLVCAPFYRQGEIAGVLYADVRVRRGSSFVAKHLSQLVSIGQDLSDRPRPVPGPSERVTPRRAPPPRESSTAASLTAMPSMRSFVVFYRCLATLLGAGVRIDRSLSLLAEQAEEPRLARLCQQMALKVQQGQSLYQAARSQAAVPPFQLQLIRLGERSGTIQRSFEQLAEHLESSYRLQQRLRSTLTYPLFLSMACILMLVLVPPFVLKGQLDMIRSSGQSPPLITRALILMSDLVSGPWLWLGLVAAGLLAAALWRRPGLRRRALLMIDGWPMLGKLMRRVAWARFAQALALQLQVGLPVLSSLGMAGEASGHPRLELSIQLSEEALRQGESVARALAAADFFPADFLQMVEVAEESGRVPELMQWVGRLYEQQMEAALEGFAAMLEPLMLAFMGFAVGFIVLATMLPMAKTLESL